MGWSYNLAIMPGWQPGGSGFKGYEGNLQFESPSQSIQIIGDKHGRMHSTEIKDF